MHHSLFTYYPDTKCFVADLTDLPKIKILPTFQIIGKNNIVEFRYSETIRDHENDIICWDYKGRFGDHEYSARILND